MICGFKNCYNKNFRKSGAFLSIFPFQQPLPSPVWPAVQLWFPPISAQHRIGCIFFRHIFSSSSINKNTCGRSGQTGTPARWILFHAPHQENSPRTLSQKLFSSAAVVSVSGSAASAAAAASVRMINLTRIAVFSALPVPAYACARSCMARSV